MLWALLSHCAASNTQQPVARQSAWVSCDLRAATLIKTRACRHVRTTKERGDRSRHAQDALGVRVRYHDGLHRSCIGCRALHCFAQAVAC